MTDRERKRNRGTPPVKIKVGMSSGKTSEPLHFVGRKDEIIQAKRITKFVDGRDILVIFHGGAFYAMDMRCYHAGGSLQNGDIEELNHKLCIICPSHKYKITLAEGEGIYKATNPREQASTPRWYSKGIKQRVHTVKEVNGNVFVLLSDVPGWIESDYYQTEKYREESSARGCDEPSC